MRRGLILILLTMGFVVVRMLLNQILPQDRQFRQMEQTSALSIRGSVGSTLQRRICQTPHLDICYRTETLVVPRWKIYSFQFYRDGQNYIYIIAANGGTARPVFRESFWATDWYADGSAILASKWSYQYGTSLYRVPWMERDPNW
jgi:hypothetical protein